MLAQPLVRTYGNLVYWAVRGYRAGFDRLVLPVLRRQELEADREAARLAGAADTAEALARVPALAAAWTEFQDLHLEPVRRGSQVVPDDPFQPFASMLADPDYQERLALLCREAAGWPGSPGDTHPATAVRLARVASRTTVPDAAGEGDRPPPAGPDPLDPAILRRLSGTLPGHLAARRRGWREWLSLAAQRPVEEALAGLATAVAAVDGRHRAPLSVRRVLDQLDRGQARQLARALALAPEPPATGPEERRAREGLVEAVCLLVGQAVVAGGGGYWAVGWVGPSRLVARDTDPEQLAEWVAAAVEHPEQVSWLRLQLASLGVDESVPVRPAPPRAPAVATVAVAPEPDGPDRRRQQSLRNASLGVLAGLVLVGGYVWLTRPADEPDRLPLFDQRQIERPPALDLPPVFPRPLRTDLLPLPTPTRYPWFPSLDPDRFLPALSPDP